MSLLLFATCAEVVIRATNNLSLQRNIAARHVAENVARITGPLNEHVKGNVLHCFAIVISYCFRPALPCYHHQTVNKNQGLCDIFPCKEQRKPMPTKK